MQKTQKPLTQGALNKKIHWGTISLRRVTLATLRDLVAHENHVSVADLVDKMVAEWKQKGKK